MRLMEKYRKVLELIKLGTDLKDDTYVSQFLESTESVLQDKNIVLDSFEIINFIKEELKNSQFGSVDKDDPDEENPWLHFVVDLATSLVKSIPDVSHDLLQAVGIPHVNKNVDRNFIPFLQFYSNVFNCNTNVLEIATYICQENLFWEKFLHVIIMKEKNKYAFKATIGCFALYVKFLLKASDLNYKPKGCEIRVLLESNIQGLIRCLYPTNLISSSQGSFCDIFEILNKTIETLDHRKLNEFLLPVIKENINFLKVLNEDHRLTTYALKCYLSTYKSDDDLVNKTQKLKTIFVDSKYSLNSKKILIVNIIQFPELCEVLLFVLDHFLNITTDLSFSLCQYFFSFHTVKSMMIRCEDPEVAQKIFSLISIHLTKYSEDLCDQSYNNKFIRNICLFGSTFLTLHDLNSFEVSYLIKSLMNISKQKYEVDDYVRSDSLELLGVILARVMHVEDLDSMIKNLCGFVCDTGALNVVRDSALLCISNLLMNRNLAVSVSGEDVDLLVCVLLKIISGKEKLLKSGAVITAVSLIKNQSDRVKCSQVCHFFPSEDGDPLKICDIYSDEERKQMMKLACTVHEKFEDPSLIELVRSFVLTSLDVDTNWDVKVHSVEYWKAVHSKASLMYPEKDSNVEFIKYLETNEFFTGLYLGYHDYENSVRNAYYCFIKLLDFGNWNISEVNMDSKRKLSECSHWMEPPVKKLGAGYKTSPADSDSSKDDETDTLEDILEEDDRSLVKNLIGTATSAEINKRDKLKVLPSYSFDHLRRLELDDPESELSKKAVLESVLDEIIQSSSDENLIDFVDCY